MVMQPISLMANVACLSESARHKLVELALGRIFALGSRPTQPGDAEQYEVCRAIIQTVADIEGVSGEPDWVPSWPRDRNKGAAGG